MILYSQRTAKQCRSLLGAALCSFLWPGGIVAGPPTVGRPILFVHGFCDQASSWSALRDGSPGGTPGIIPYVTSSQPSLYPDPANYDVYYDGASVRTMSDGVDLLSPDNKSGATKNSRFFSIDFFDPFAGDSSFDPGNTFVAMQVADVSNLNKADELAQVIRAITALTHVKDVIVVAHSMGGLDTRAYLENLAVPFLGVSCYSDTYLACAAAQKTMYAQDIAQVITLDTPHLGAETALLQNTLSLIADPALTLFTGCAAVPTLNRQELTPVSYVIDELNNVGPGSLPNTPITAIKSYTFPGLVDPNGDDGVVEETEQSIQSAVPGVSSYEDLPNYIAIPPFGGPCFPLHLLTCVGSFQSTAKYLEQPMGGNAVIGVPSGVTVQATLDGNPWSGPVVYCKRQAKPHPLKPATRRNGLA